MPSSLSVDLNEAPAARCQLSVEQTDQVRRLLEVYLRDLGADEQFESVLRRLGTRVPEAYAGEIQGLAERAGLPRAHVLAGNLYYDALKGPWGCTTFAVETPAGPLHARNLDWSTENRLLNDCTLVTRFDGAPAGPFTTVGWPGFVGALSGVAPGRFAVTLNAVRSDDPAGEALPVVFLVRQVLETATSFDAAVQALATTPIASDCLLMVSGPHRLQMVVIERTPTRHVLRHPDGGAIFATNDYLALQGSSRSLASRLSETSRSRFERIVRLVRANPPHQLEACLDHLADPELQVEITVQQMAFAPRSGALALRVP